MALSIRIPGLVKLLVVKDPAEILAVNAAASVDRPLSGRGPLINRPVGNKLKVFRTAGGETWPAFCSRLDPLRIKHSEEVGKKLSDVPGELGRLAPEINELAAYVRKVPGARPHGVVVQQAVGRLFFDDFRASEESYGAAQTLSDWLTAGPVRTLVLRLTGKIQAALDTILVQARGDTACAHGIGLALHNIVDSVELMRKLARSTGAMRELSPAEAAQRTLRAPARVVREARDSAQAEGVRAGERSIILLSVDSARACSRDSGIAFFSGQWNQCPAHAFVPALLAEIWKIARAQ